MHYWEKKTKNESILDQEIDDLLKSLVFLAAPPPPTQKYIRYVDDNYSFLLLISIMQ